MRARRIRVAKGRAITVWPAVTVKERARHVGDVEEQEERDAQHHERDDQGQAGEPDETPPSAEPEATAPQG